MNNHKLLSLDGGGSWAVLQLFTLLDRYGNVKGREILKEYDLISANSGGSIVLAALCENWTIEEAIGLFMQEDLRKQIFSKNSFKERFFPIDYLRFFGIKFGPKYSSKRKREAFEKLFPICHKERLKDLPKLIGKPELKIVVCAYDALNNNAVFFKSYQSKTYFDDVTLVQAIHASSNAPIQYFDFPARFKAKGSEVFYELWDGALGGFNNPSAVAVNEAIQGGIDPESICLVSLGTGNVLTSMEAKSDFYRSRDTAVRLRHKKFRLNSWKRQFSFFSKSVMQQAKTILYQPPDWSNEISATLMFGASKNFKANRFIRLSPLIYSNENHSDEARQLINKLYKLDMDLTSDEDVKLLKDCFELWKKDGIYNQPVNYRLDRDGSIVCQNGSLTYSEVMDFWKI